MLSDTQQRLTEWARWVKTSDSGLRMGYNRLCCHAGVLG